MIKSIIIPWIFKKAESDLSTRYTNPIRLGVNEFLQPLLNMKEENCSIKYDAHEGFHDLKLKRKGTYLDFNDLSGGMKEQLNTALRLSMADVLKSEHDDCLPILLDDSFSNSDPERIIYINNMLTKAATNGLQIILITCSPELHAGIEAKRIYL